MEIDPYLQLAMLITAFLAGAGLGGLWELLVAVRVLLGAHEAPLFLRARYERPLPLLHRGVPWREGRTARRVWRGLVEGVGDLLYCLLFALTLELILYRFNDGEFRVAVPLLLFAGLAAFRVSVARVTGLLVAWMAYLLAALWMYLTALLQLPWRILRALARRLILPPLVRLSHRHRARITQRLSAAQLAYAEQGFQKEGERGNGSPKKAKRKQGDAMDHSHSGDRDPHTGADPHGKSSDGVAAARAI
ncbi:MAG: spore cortex biosynthesis protein YabQ [Clostridia bacterium]|nr:spore cortex biosynthesis protein YabQ [Clostridia bacterium]